MDDDGYSVNLMNDLALELSIINFIRSLEKCRGKSFNYAELDQILTKVGVIRDEFMVLGEKL